MIAATSSLSFVVLAVVETLCAAGDFLEFFVSIRKLAQTVGCFKCPRISRSWELS